MMFCITVGLNAAAVPCGICLPVLLLHVKAGATDEEALNLIMSIRTLLVRRGSPGTTRNFEEQPKLEMPITPVLPPNFALLRFKPPPGVAPPSWQPEQLASNTACTPEEARVAATLTSEPATPNTFDASVVVPLEDLMANVA